MNRILLIYRIIIINITILSFSFPLPSCDKTKHKEKEPNELLSNASHIYLGQIVKGNFKNINDKDTFILDLRKLKKKKINIQINLSRIKGYDIALDIYEENRLIKTIDDYRKNKSEAIHNLLITNKIYYTVVKISSLNELLYKQSINNKHNNYTEANYYLSIKEKEIKPFYEQESNDTIDKANNIKINSFIEGSFDPFYNISGITNNILFNNRELNSIIRKLEQDWYYIDIEDEGLYNLTIILEKTKNIDAILGIYNNKINKLVNKKKNSEGESIVNLTVEGMQRYYILVSGIPHGYKTNNNKIYPYRLSVNINPKNKQTEAEPNNNINKANTIDENSIYGILSPKDDEDFYIIELKENNNESTEEKISINENKLKTLSIHLSPVENVDLAIYLYDENGKVVRIYDNGRVNEEEKIQSLDINQAEQIILSIKGSYQNKSDNYKQSYKIETKIKEHKSNYELEINDKTKNIDNKQSDYKINKIEADTVVYGYINPGGKNPYQESDIDNFEVKLQNNTNYEVKLEGTAGIDIKLSIQYRDKSPVHNFEAIKSMDGEIKTGVLKVPYDPFDPDWGVYNIRIESEFSKKGNPDKTYNFILKELPK